MPKSISFHALARPVKMPRMGTPDVVDPEPAALLPLTLQNSYRARYRAMRPGWETSGDQLEAIVRAYVTPDSRVLDLGCGRGGVVELFWRDVKLAAGIDPDPPSLTGHRAAGMPILRGIGERLPFAEASFDLVVSVWVLEHLREPQRVFDEVGRVLRPGGHFVFLTPNLRNPLLMLNRVGKALPLVQTRLVSRFYGRREADTFPVQYRANTVGALRALAAASGLEVAELRVVPDPTYLAVNGLMFTTSVMAERLMPKGWGVHLIGDLMRR
jgi:SAM-dependent methyltransferase